jgi:benzylsuccinate CoA-transferase BbsF subunit
MVRQNGFGLDGPYKNLAAFGMTLAAIAGIPNFIGWPDRGPLPVGVGAYTDCISPRLASAALIAALDYRDRTGRGQLLDLSQFETAIYFFLPGILDYAVNGREPVRNGNACAFAVPHNVYPCKGKDCWCTITVFNNEQWVELCKVIGKPEYGQDSRFDTLLHRKEREKEVDDFIKDWTINFTPKELMTLLQGAGIPAGVVENAADLYADPQLRHRNLFWSIEHPEMGAFTHLGASLEMSKTPAQAYLPSPCLGEHNEYVLTKILGKTDEEFLDILQTGVLE